jgi:hypothetical protein
VRLEKSFVIATTPPAIVLPDGTYRYRFEARGTVRTSTVVVRHETGLIVIDEGTATENVPIVTQRRIDPSTFATRSYAIDAGDAHAVVAISGNDATVTQETFVRASMRRRAPPSW